MSQEPADLPNELPAADSRSGCAAIIARLCIGLGIFVLIFMGMNELMIISLRTQPGWGSQRSLYLWQQVDVLFTMMMATTSILGGLLFMRWPRAGQIVLLAYAAIGIVWAITACGVDIHFIATIQHQQAALNQPPVHRAWGLAVPTVIIVLWRVTVLVIMLGTEIKDGLITESQRHREDNTEKN